MSKIAIVASGRTRNGAHYRIFDDAYINNTPEENERLRMRACQAAYEIMRSNALAELERKKRETSQNHQ